MSDRPNWSLLVSGSRGIPGSERGECDVSGEIPRHAASQVCQLRDRDPVKYWLRQTLENFPFNLGPRGKMPAPW